MHLKSPTIRTLRNNKPQLWPSTPQTPLQACTRPTTWHHETFHNLHLSKSLYTTDHHSWTQKPVELWTPRQTSTWQHPQHPVLNQNRIKTASQNPVNAPIRSKHPPTPPRCDAPQHKPTGRCQALSTPRSILQSIYTTLDGPYILPLVAYTTTHLTRL